MSDLWVKDKRMKNEIYETRVSLPSPHSPFSTVTLHVHLSWSHLPGCLPIFKGYFFVIVLLFST